MGALPALVGRHGLSCPIYCTVPVHKMGQMFLYDYCISRRNEEDFKDFDLDDTDLAFECITQLKYNQSVNLTGKKNSFYRWGFYEFFSTKSIR
jgi:cleavage and polyadenylation specificity factor subunit 2